MTKTNTPYYPDVQDSWREHPLLAKYLRSQNIIAARINNELDTTYDAADAVTHEAIGIVSIGSWSTLNLQPSVTWL